MDLKAPRYLQSPSVFSQSKTESQLDGNPSFYCTSKENPFADAFLIPDPLCKLNLKETSEFVRSFPMAAKDSDESRRRGWVSSAGRRRVEAPSTPGRPVFCFSSGVPPRKSVPSKWDDAEKWLISSSCHESPAHVTRTPDPSNLSRQHDAFTQKGDAFGEKVRTTEEKVSGFHGPVVSLDPDIALHGVSSEVLKDKFTDNVELVFPNFRYSEPSKDSFLLTNAFCEATKDGTTEVAPEVHRRDIGTEMTPLGSSTTSRFHTPIKSSSPARHNTPADRSGLLSPSKTSIDISELQDCHFAKLQLSSQYDSMFSNWSSREEEEEEVSKSLRHSENGGGKISIVESRASALEDEERTKSCIRYQREEAKIQAWVNLQSAKAEAQSRKLEVKIQKMRSNMEEKLMKRMAIAERRAAEWRAAAQLQHSQQMLRASEQAQKISHRHNGSYLHNHASCGCFPCNDHL